MPQALRTNNIAPLRESVSPFSNSFIAAIAEGVAALPIPSRLEAILSDTFLLASGDIAPYKNRFTLFSRLASFCTESHCSATLNTPSHTA